MFHCGKSLKIADIGKTDLLMRRLYRFISIVRLVLLDASSSAAKNILYVSFDNPIVKMISVEDVLNTYEMLHPIECVR